MAIQGLRDTSNFVADQRPKNWREAILLLYPNGKAPLTALTSVMKSSSTDDPEFSWWEKSLPTQRFALQAAITAAQTSFNLAAGAAAQLKEGTLLLVEHTDEIVRVSADPAGDANVPVQRGFSGTTAQAIANISASGVNPNVKVIGSAYEENSDAPTGVNYDPTKKFNYTQIFRNALEMSRTASKTRLRTGDQVKEAKRECLELHSIEMEMAFWLGKRFEGTLAGKPVRTTGGVVSFIDSGNIVANNGTAVTMDILEGWLERIFRFGSSEKMGFAGNLALLGLQQAIRKNVSWQFRTGEKEFGMDVTRIVCPFGTLALKTHPLFNLSSGGTTGGGAYYGMNSWLVVLDMDNIRYRPLEGGDTQYQKVLQDNGLDGMKSGYITEAGLEVWHPTTHFLVKGIVAGAADA